MLSARRALAAAPRACRAAAPALGAATRAFGTTDGPWRHIKPSFTEKKKHFNEVLVYGDARKLLETAQDVLNEPSREFPRKLWEVLAQRSIESMHLLQPLELAILARAFDVHNPTISVDIYPHLAARVRVAESFPGLAILVLADVLPRRLRSSELPALLERLGRQMASVMWELTPAHALRVLEALTAAGVRDPSLSSRVAAKVRAQLHAPDALQLVDLVGAAETFAGQGHRDADLLQSLASRAAVLGAGDPAGPEAMESITASLQKLGVEVAQETLAAREEAEAEAPAQTPASQEMPGPTADAAFTVEDEPPRRR